MNNVTTILMCLFLFIGLFTGFIDYLYLTKGKKLGWILYPLMAAILIYIPLTQYQEYSKIIKQMMLEYFLFMVLVTVIARFCFILWWKKRSKKIEK